MPDDRALLAALRKRSPQAFKELFELYSDRMFRLAVKMLADEDEAEDVVQDAFLRFFEKLESFQGRSQIGTWLYRTVHNLCIDRLRTRKNFVELPDEGGDDALPIPTVFIDWRKVPEICLSEAEVNQQLDQAIVSLPETLRALFVLREIEGLSTRESAEVLGISESAAKVRLHRARLLLREKLTDYFVELGRKRELIP